MFQLIISWDTLPKFLKQILPQSYTYLIKTFNELPPFQTAEGFEISQFELDAFVDVCDKEKANKWFKDFESRSKTTMPETKRYEIKEKRVLFREKRHCLHSDIVKKKQGNRETKHPQSTRVRNIGCTANIHLRLESWRIELSHPLEINLKFTHNHVVNSAESLSFRHIDGTVREKYLELFKDGHYPASAMYVYEDELHLSATNDQELLELLADRAKNPDYDYIAKLFQKYHDTELGGCNGSSMFQCLVEVVNSFNNSGRGKAALQEFNADTGKSFILCIVTELMCCVHEKVRQAGELYYMDASSSFEHFNNSIILFYTSCAISALPLGLFITSDEFEVTLEKAINLLKSILPPLSPPSATRR
ncbi:unnamed protein product [Rhizophagus irregularis]|nr:unnamed protein product [Rhizophagus irregularis]